MIGALRLVPGAADGFQGDGVVSAAGDASHYASGVHGVTLRIASWWRQRGDVGQGAASVRPGHVGHGLGHLAHREIVWATRCWEKKNINKSIFVDFSTTVPKPKDILAEMGTH